VNGFRVACFSYFSEKGFYENNSTINRNCAKSLSSALPKVFDRGIRVSFGMPSGFAPYIFHIRLNQDRNLHYNLFDFL